MFRSDSLFIKSYTLQFLNSKKCKLLRLLLKIFKERLLILSNVLVIRTLSWPLVGGCGANLFFLICPICLGGGLGFGSSLLPNILSNNPVYYYKDVVKRRLLLL